MRIGIGHDTHRLVAGRQLILGGVRIPYRLGLAGHSDGDVVLHAVCDALLGGCALGDIGDLFSDSDPANQNLDSARMVQDVLSRVRALGYRILNLDVTIHAQAPNLGALKPRIAGRVAELLGLDASQVNVKAKTGEGLGPIGRCEAIACDAAVLLAGPGQLESEEG